jgi:hypothetical protein
MADQADMRAGDGDRDRVAELLRVAVSEGRISIQELHERLDRTYAARTMGELDRVVADLPLDEDLPAVLQDGSGVLRLHTARGKTVRQTGPWVVPPRISVQCRWGTARLDFTQARCAQREVAIEVECDSLFGDIVIVVPRGWRVRSDEVTTRSMGSVHNRPPEPPAPDAVTLRLSGHVRSGDIWVRYRHRRG